MSDRRSLPVPDGLQGERVDAGLARLLGVSRTQAAALAESGRVGIDGAAARKSDRLVAGSWLEIDLPTLAAPTEPIPVAGMTILYDDDDVVVVDSR